VWAVFVINTKTPTKELPMSTHVSARRRLAMLVLFAALQRAARRDAKWRAANLPKTPR
jgi:hypothetical protein